MENKFVLKKTKDFDNLRLKSKKARVHSAFFIVYKKNNLGHLRIGWTLPRKSGNAVERNHIKRLLRESISSFPDKSKFPLDCNFIFQNCSHKDFKSWNVFYPQIFEKIFLKAEKWV